jgi:hypothetical protein
MGSNLPSLNINAGPYMTPAECAEQLARVFYRLDASPPNNVAGIASSIRARVMTLEKCNMAECNGVVQPDGFIGWTEENQDQTNILRIRAQKEIRDIIREAVPAEHDDRVAIEFQGDPRGCPVLIHIDDRERVASFW